MENKTLHLKSINAAFIMCLFIIPMLFVIPFLVASFIDSSNMAVLAIIPLCFAAAIFGFIAYVFYKEFKNDLKFQNFSIWWVWFYVGIWLLILPTCAMIYLWFEENELVWSFSFGTYTWWATVFYALAIILISVSINNINKYKVQ